MLHRMLLSSSLLLAALTLSVVADAKLHITADATAGFRASGPAGLTIDGKTSEVAVADDGTHVVVTVKLGAIDTGIGLRDKHTRGYLEVATFPTAQLDVARADLSFPAAGAQSGGDAKGNLTVHGQTKEVTFHYKAKLDGDTLAIEGSTRININDYGVKTPSYLGISVKPEVEVYARFHAKDE